MADCRSWFDLVVKQVCCGYGVALMTLASYRAYALQVRKAKKHAKGDDLAVVAASLVERYTKMGLRREVLAAIAYDVFNIKVAD